MLFGCDTSVAALEWSWLLFRTEEHWAGFSPRAARQAEQLPAPPALRAVLSVHSNGSSEAAKV